VLGAVERVHREAHLPEVRVVDVDLHATLSPRPAQKSSGSPRCSR
jgi:hypothetical protein